MDPEAVLSRIRTRAVALGALAACVAFFINWPAGLSLTICAAVVIFSFLVFERLTARVLPQQGKKGFWRTLPLLLVTVGGLGLLGLVFSWKEFDPTAGLVGLSVVVLAIGAEVLQGEKG